jgi:hypothetical protein
VVYHTEDCPNNKKVNFGTDMKVFFFVPQLMSEFGVKVKNLSVETDIRDVCGILFLDNLLPRRNWYSFRMYR